MKWWLTFVFFLAAFFSFAYIKPNENKEVFGFLDNGCVIYSLTFKNALTAKEMLGDEIWSRVLAIHFSGKLGHAVTVFVYENVTYVYDSNLGTFPVAAYPLYDPLMIAEICYPKLVIIKAYYLEPTMLLHYQQNHIEYETDSFKIY